MTDIFHEVDEEVRRERLRQLWQKWGGYLLLAVFVIVLAVGGWRGWNWWQDRQAAAAGAAFEAAVALADAGRHREAAAAFAKIASEAPAGYRVLARLREAAALARDDRAAAVAAYDAAAQDSSVPRVFRELAAVRAGAILVDTARFDELRARLEPLSGATNPFRHSARELLALAAWRAGDMTAARQWFDTIMTDAETPAATRARIEMLMTLAAAQGKG